MKKFAFLLTFLAFAPHALAQDSLKVIRNDVQRALHLAGQKDRLVFTMVYAEWCTHCNKMRKEVLSNPEVVDFFNTHFVNLMVDSDLPEGKQFMRRHNVRSFPHFLFLDRTGAVVYGLNGEFSVSELLAEAAHALNPKMQLPYLQQQCKADQGNAAKCLEYINALKKGRDKEQIAQAAKNYLDTKKRDDWFNETDWKIIAAGVNDFQSDDFQFILSHREEFARVASPQRVTNKIINVAMAMQNEPIEKSDTLQYKQNRLLIRSLQLARADSLVFRQDLEFLPRNKLWRDYVASTQESADRFAFTDTKVLNEIGTHYIAAVSDPGDLKRAIDWVKRSNAKNETHETNFILAQLYRKTGDSKQALQYAQRSKAIVTQMGWDSKKIDAFIAAVSNQ